MALRWGVGLPGPFYVSGRVIPRRRRRTASSGGGSALLGFLIFIGILLLLEILLAYWCVVLLTGVVIWSERSIRYKQIVPWPFGTWIWVPWAERTRRAPVSGSAERTPSGQV